MIYNLFAHLSEILKQKEQFQKIQIAVTRVIPFQKI